MFQCLTMVSLHNSLTGPNGHNSDPSSYSKRRKKCNNIEMADPDPQLLTRTAWVSAKTALNQIKYVSHWILPDMYSCINDTNKMGLRLVIKFGHKFLSIRSELDIFFFLLIEMFSIGRLFGSCWLSPTSLGQINTLWAEKAFKKS